MEGGPILDRPSFSWRRPQTGRISLFGRPPKPPRTGRFGDLRLGGFRGVARTRFWWWLVGSKSGSKTTPKSAPLVVRVAVPDCGSRVHTHHHQPGTVLGTPATTSADPVGLVRWWLGWAGHQPSPPATTSHQPTTTSAERHQPTTSPPEIRGWATIAAQHRAPSRRLSWAGGGGRWWAVVGDYCAVAARWLRGRQITDRNAGA